MSKENLLRKIRIIANQKRFKILELTQTEEIGLTELSRKLNLSYNKCSDYVSLLEHEKLVKKQKKGKEQFVKSIVKLKDNSVEL